MRFDTTKRDGYTVIHNSTQLASTVNQTPEFFSQLLSNMLHAKIIYNRNTDKFLYSTSIPHQELCKVFKAFKIECK